MSIVPVVKTNGNIRICVDFKYLNTQVKMHSYPVPKLEELLLNFNDCKYFSKLDLKNAYLQVALYKKLQDFLVMNTQKGMFKFKRLPFGISAAPAIFQKFISELLQGVTKARAYFDDILIGGATEQELYENTKKVLELLQNRNILLNINKCLNINHIKVLKLIRQKLIQFINLVGLLMLVP